MEIKLEYTTVFEKNFASDNRIIINRGGSRSGKTIAIIQLFILKALQENNKRFVIVRDSLTNAKISVVKDMLDYISINNLGEYFDYTKQPPQFRANGTNSTIEFIGAYDNPLRFKGLESNYWWFEEASEINKSFFDQAIMRMTRQSNDDNSNKFYLSFNPSDPYSWIRDLELRGDVEVIESTYRDNPFLTSVAIEEIERLRTTDYDMYLIYGQGQYAEVRGAIFKNWEMVDDWPEGFEQDKSVYGMDWGYSIDPSTLIQTYKVDDTIYVKELMYQPGLTNQDIGDKLRGFGIKGYDEIIADSAEPKSIEEVSRMGFNMLPARKGPDSIKNGLDILKRYKIKVIGPSPNLKKELINYKNKKDKNGNFLPVPEDKWNHCIDPLRYIALNKYGISNSGDYMIFIGGERI